MSRHRNVRNLDYEEVLDDETPEDVSPADLERLDASVDAITQRLGEGFTIREIKDTAWYYYFDVEKATNYLLENRARKQEKAQVQEPKTNKQGMSENGLAESNKDTSRRNHVLQPKETSTKAVVIGKAETRKDNSPAKPVSDQSDMPRKLSKLQQLAKDKAAVKRAAQKDHDSSSSLANSLARLRNQSREAKVTTAVPTSEKWVIKATSDDESPKISHAESKIDTIDAPTPPSSLFNLAQVQVASPSAFAHIVLGVSQTRKPSAEILADQDFSCFTVATNSTISTIKASFTSPSPDDIVQKAQANSKGMTKLKPAAQDTNQSNGSGALPLPESTHNRQHTYKPRKGRTSRGEKPQTSFVVVGHVDAGKSTLFGRLLYDLGDIDERSMQRLKRESEKSQKASFAYAWAMDSSVEERERGVTIDFATSNFETDKTVFTILDAPGHKDFVPNMIAGASQADFAILVIDASRGAFESGFDAAGQTKEHAVLIRALGIQKILVAVNKLDNVDWSHDRFQDIKVQLGTYLKHIGFDPESIVYIPCSGLSGQNVAHAAEKTKEPSNLSWYSGETLLQAMERMKPISKDETAPFRMIISDIQSTANSSNVTVSGRLSAGELQKDDLVLCMPSRETAVVKAMSSTNNDDTAFAGDNVTITLGQIDITHLRIGDVLCHISDPIENFTKFRARLVTFEMLRPLLAGTSIILHRGKSDMPATITKIEIPQRNQPDHFKSARHVTGGTQALMTLQLEKGVIPMEIFSTNKDLGRVILRREGDTVAAGVVIETLA